MTKLAEGLCLCATQRGVALVAVLWMVAALSLLVSALSATGKADVQAAATSRDHARAAAIGDAAIELAVLDLRINPAGSGNERPDAVRERVFSFEGEEVHVRLVPSSGFVNLNLAEAPLLQALFAQAGGMSEKEAAILAQRVIDWRDPDQAMQPEGAERERYRAAGVDFVPRDGPFAEVEDLLQVLGVDFPLYAKVRDLVTVHGQHVGVDPLAAPSRLVNVLAGGNLSVTTDFLAARKSVQGAPPDSTRLEQSFLHTEQDSSIYRVEARVSGDGDLVLMRARWIDVSRIAAMGEPRLVLETEAVKVEKVGEVLDGV